MTTGITAGAAPRPLAKKKARPSESAFHGLVLGMTLVALAFLVWLLVSIVIEGAGSLSIDFLTSRPSSSAELAGFNSAIRGSLVLMFFVIIIAIPVGVAAAIYLEKIGVANSAARQRRLRAQRAALLAAHAGGASQGAGHQARRALIGAQLAWGRLWPPVVRLIDVNISNLAAVPSIIYGLLGLAVFVTFVGVEKSLLAGGLTLAVLVLPIIIIASREALRAVPTSIEEGAMALGATRWQAVWRQVVPAALPGMLTGAILALSRAIGETAPLIVVGGIVFGTAVPSINPLDAGTESLFAMPLQIYFWADLPQQAFRDLAAAGIIVLLAILVLMNTAAILLRNRFSRRW